MDEDTQRTVLKSNSPIQERDPHEVRQGRSR
jgi:hypothetical protein